MGGECAFLGVCFPRHSMERDNLAAAEKKVRDAIASPESDGWKEPVAEKEEEKKPQLGGPAAPKLECKVVEKIIGQTKDKLDLRLAKASIEIDKPAKAVFDLVWDVNGYKVLSSPHNDRTVNNLVALGQPDRL